MMTNERTVIVTGAAQGIGYAIAESFINNGDFVAIFDLNEEAAISAAEKLGNAKGYKVNVADEPNVKAAVEQVIAERGTVDVLVNNAGLQFISPVEDFPVEKWDLVNDVILKGTFLLTKHALPAMQKQKKGRIINISSAHGRIPDAYKSAYCAAKFGQVGFTKVTALENALNGITCNTIMPGPVRTELIEKQLPVLAEQDGTTVEEALNHHILGKQWIKRLLEPSEIGATAVFLASEGAAAITGEEIGVTGGI
ncbi:3-hydroxybutyrate dehydrogenase [Peribacillus butanolivorans]|uniref:3-hydroxybutyrate dehydrogenase n=2 Tax=Peribacillus butanolivorans TaxID=421767 RepID=A0AAX0RRY9_9BACI|nr:SDR family NAD(P)-dependent oxidoreductase [Peribacillus butanolivorans]PEJ34180.1 3-hydroxybutyrate dehydrogenase [Peribacillus butanolivorans]